MKNFILKNAMVVAAMAIAAGSYGLMSFGIVSHKTIDQIQEPELFWYEVDLDNNELGAQKNTTPLSKTQVMATPSITTCNDTASEICLAGYDTEQNEGDPYTAPSSSTHRINQSNP